jgi:hypothetical protein
MEERLKNHKAVFRTVTLLTQSGESEPMRGAVGKIEPAFSGEVFILRIANSRSTAPRPE